MNSYVRFLEYLIKETDNRKLNWSKIQYDEYLNVKNNYKSLIYYSNNANEMSDVAKLAAICSDFSTTLAIFNSDKVIYKTALRNVDIYLIENISYQTTFPHYSYELNLIYIDSIDLSNCFDYTIDNSSDEQYYQKLLLLARIVCIHPIDEAKNAMDFINNILEDEENDTNNETPKYKTSGKWDLTTPYEFAVEIDSYSGDKYLAGTYMFRTTNTTLGEAPVYDVYIKKSVYNKISQLGSSDYTVGGAKSFPISITLNKGDYVYIVPYSNLIYTPKGYLTFTLSD